MSQPTFRLPEPSLPEHQLLRESGPLPPLSSGLRERVLIDCHRQVRYGRWADRLRIAGAVMAASLMVALIWHFRWVTPTERSQTQPDFATTPERDAEVQPSYSSANSESLANPSVKPKVPQGGSSGRGEMKDMQQINQLIEDLNGRNNTLCGFLPFWSLP